MTGRIYIDLFTSLDGVAQAPGGRDEDPSHDFPYGGWQAPFPDETIGASVWEGISELDALLLGRRTYDIFAAYWPQQSHRIADVFNRVPKYVASRGLPTLDWEGTSQLGMDLVREVEELRERHESIHVIGSVDFVQTLLKEQLFDVLTLWVHPVVLGQGKKVFPEGAHPATVTLLEPAITGPLGVVQLRYGPKRGDVQTGEVED
ncbi:MULTISPECIES: dihydrofolate reductase family protein [Microbacterium]|uniref:dihydrofolate reductase family protein n=1 Tax=Microbacterium TaxID=33882 RepID=UPI000D64BB16|nr:MULTISPECIES: dihydrofolate reductase family protein [Microbacterium]